VNQFASVTDLRFPYIGTSSTLLLRALQIPSDARDTELGESVLEKTFDPEDKKSGSTVPFVQTMAAINEPCPPRESSVLSKSGRSMLLNFLSGSLNILSGSVRRSATRRAAHDRNSRDQQQDDFFGHIVCWQVQVRSEPNRKQGEAGCDDQPWGLSRKVFQKPPA
jgi:hypothetical protein